MASALLEVRKDGSMLSSVPLAGKKSVTIGRSLDCDIVINHPSVSRTHAKVSAEGGAYFLTDLRSTHGTKLSGQPLPPDQPMRLFDGLEVQLGQSSRIIVPCGTVASVVAAVAAAAEHQRQEAKLVQEREDADGVDALTASRPASAALPPKAAAELAAQDHEDEEIRAHLPMHFGKTQQKEAASLEKQHAAYAREDGGVKIVGSHKGKGKKPLLKMAPKLGTGLNVPAATPTLVALQQQRATAAVTGGAHASSATATKVLPAHLPARPPAEEEEAEVGPQMPPGVGGASMAYAGPQLPPGMKAGADDDLEVGPPLPPGMMGGASDDQDVEVGPPLPPGMMGGQGEPEVGPRLLPAMRGGASTHVPVRGGYDPTDMSQQVYDADDVQIADADDEDDDGGGQPRLPVSHQVALAAHSKTVTCLALDRGGGRLVSGGSDSDIYFWDFAGMTKELRPFRHVEEPLGQVELRSVDYSPAADKLIVAGSSNQPVILDRDGRKLCTLMKGDPYIRDMRHTKGHVAACTCARWHVHEHNTFATCSEDGTVRLWDAEVAMERDDMSLNVQGGQKSVCVLKDGRGIKTGTTCAAWRPDGDALLCGAKDGSLQLWEFRTSEYKPVVLLPKGVPVSEFKAEQLRPATVARGAHASGSDVSCVRWRKDGNVFASRSTDGTLKVWDLRRFDAPLAEWGDLPCISPMAAVDFSPDERMLVAGTAVRKGDGAPQLNFFSLSSMQRIAQLDMEGNSLVSILWHARLNQILVGCNNGRAYALYDPSMSEKGVMFCNVKAAPKRAALSFTGGAMHVITPHALPMFREDNEDHRKKRRIDRKDPLKSKLPEQVLSGPGTGGKLNRSYQQALLASLSGGISGLGGTKDKIEMFQNEDPREELLKYAKLAEEDPIFVTPAYAVNQPATLTGGHLAKTVESDDDADAES
uniref:FHA domain-containing protein n=1 Tax=Calcidiscus leptoporus TaxID=127549 RepID=A0A7S0JCP2_9EUKA|mmetsp:Transcript_51660/g.118676  ORF Transcript_51660/g.118676 Transcript_51660/m.118676 type:complete len:926 (+) Transcript_51660:43-2820(+)